MAEFSMEVEGLPELKASLQALKGKLPNVIIYALGEAAGVIISSARPTIPRRTGKAQASLRGEAHPKGVRIRGGGTDVPYYAWLEFGGNAGRGGSVQRALVPEGRYIMPAYQRNKEQVKRIMVTALTGIEGVSSG